MSPARLAACTFPQPDEMSFEIACPSCGQTLIADEAMTGYSVNCPACQSAMLVEEPVEKRPEAEDDFGLSEELDISATRAIPPQEPAESTEATETEEADDGDEQADPGDEATAGTECPECGVFVPPGRFECPSCRFNIQLGRRVEAYGDDEHLEGTVGFERFVLKKMHATESLASVYIWSHAAFVFTAVVMCLIFRKWWLEIGGATVALYGAYHWLAYQYKWFYRGKSFIWAARLFTGRLWRWKVSKRKYWRVKDPSFTDEKLSRRDDLGEFQIIDLQGTGISDKGLSQFQFLSQLDVLVLKGTNVTESGVVELQRTIPRTCIWY